MPRCICLWPCRPVTDPHICDEADVLLGGVHKVDGGHIRDALALSRNHQVQGDPVLAQIADLEQGCNDVLGLLVEYQHLNDKVLHLSPMVFHEVKAQHAQMVATFQSPRSLIRS